MDATANANLAARLPYLFATCRFAHYLKCMVRDKIGGFATQASLESWLNKWISGFVTSDPTASDETKAKFPLAEAQVVVEEDESNPGYYTSKFYLRAPLSIGRPDCFTAARLQAAGEQEII